MIWLDWFRAERQIQSWDAKQNGIVYIEMHALWDLERKVKEK